MRRGNRPQPCTRDRAVRTPRGTAAPQPDREEKRRPVALRKIARFWPRAQGVAVADPDRPAVDVDALSAFGSEGAGAHRAGGESSEGVRGALALAPRPEGDLAVAAARRPGVRYRAPLLWTAVVLLTAAGASAATWAYQRFLLRPAPARFTVETTPPGMDVAVDGQVRGQTPLTLALAAGTYDVTVGTGAAQRTLHPTLAAGASLVQHMEMTPAAAATGALRVETETAGLPVAVDGVEKGVSPLTIDALAPGNHDIVIGRDAAAVQRSVAVQANETVSFFLPARPAAPSAGWLSTASPVVAQIMEGGRVIGSTELDRVMLPAGEHSLVLVNEALGYRAERRVLITGGKVSRLAIDPPMGTLNINAQPWAEVWLDGQSLGQTPIGNLSTPIGSHEIIFRHPQLGERRETIVVTVQQPARLGVDMRRQ